MGQLLAVETTWLDVLILVSVPLATHATSGRIRVLLILLARAILLGLHVCVPSLLTDATIRVRHLVSTLTL